MDIKVGDRIKTKKWSGSVVEVLGVAEKLVYCGERTSYKGMFRLRGAVWIGDVIEVL